MPLTHLWIFCSITITDFLNESICGVLSSPKQYLIFPAKTYCQSYIGLKDTSVLEPFLGMCHTRTFLQLIGNWTSLLAHLFRCYVVAEYQKSIPHSNILKFDSKFTIDIIIIKQIIKMFFVLLLISLSYSEY